jgi:hypothetical protein
MNLKCGIQDVFAVERGARLKNPPRLTHFMESFFGLNLQVDLEWAKPFPFMSLLFPRKATSFFCCALFLLIPAVFGQTNYYSGNGTEYAVVGSLAGDQVFPDVAVNATGGFVVWNDNATDGSGWGVSARKLDGTLSGTLSTFRVNVTGTNDQENARVALLKNGGAAFVWQGGKPGLNQHIYARFLTPTNIWLTTTDIVVSTFTNNFQTTPAIATLNNSNVVVVWASFNQVKSNSLLDVYGQILSPTGAKVGANFLVNQFTNYNQRSPAIAALKNGGFVVAWVSEQQRVAAVNSGNPSSFFTAAAAPVPSVDIYAKLYSSNGIPAAGEFLINTDMNPCANPGIAAASDGGFSIAWCARDMLASTNSLDIYARPFSGSGTGGSTMRVNSYLYGDQYAPKISSIGLDYLLTWISLLEDGSHGGIYGRFFHNDGSLIGQEFRINTTTISEQKQPVVASDGINQFLVVWISYIGTPYSFDLFAQRYANVSAILQPMAAPFVYEPFTLSNGVYQPQLQVSWPVLLGISVSNYEVYVDGAASPTAAVTSNQWTMTAADGLTTSSTHSFALDYVATDGRHSPLSASTDGTTWNGCYWSGIPCEWMTQYYGNNVADWPAANADTDGEGMTTLQEFSAGTIPTNSASALVVQLAKTSQGMFLNWNTQPGMTYQVQVTTNFTTWSNFGSPRFAPGTTDSIIVGNGTASYYRVVLVR